MKRAYILLIILLLWGTFFVSSASQTFGINITVNAISNNNELSNLVYENIEEDKISEEVYKSLEEDASRKGITGRTIDIIRERKTLESGAIILLIVIIANIILQRNEEIKIKVSEDGEKSKYNPKRETFLMSR